MVACNCGWETTEMEFKLKALPRLPVKQAHNLKYIIWTLKSVLFELLSIIDYKQGHLMAYFDSWSLDAT